MYTLISIFERIFPGNDQVRVQGCFRRFLTFNKSFGGGVPFAVHNNPLTCNWGLRLKAFDMRHSLGYQITFDGEGSGRTSVG